MQGLFMEDLARELVSDHIRRAEARRVRSTERRRRSWRRSFGLGLVGAGLRIAGCFEPGVTSLSRGKRRLLLISEPGPATREL